ncbi:PQQ-binding-like beta-propeller repeat protein [Blastococcus capsensis]|uniref:outer membrane protein assembly factor BamB family protein n=1 Tax=Blastococcus capsensis TaxID=1564163 RepID=UPI0025401FAE|nr:PQQ-binding-like beta-propeller repeat protein [Blastococcus capsensis]MDK3256085.1 PQQ-binding-like beta-propeller repeat protein [Blastococcus capsensis]
MQGPPLRVWVWTAATVALVVVAALLWRGSDAAATDSTTAPPAGVPQGTPAGDVSEAWSTTGGPVPEDVVEDGRVLVGSSHGIRALDPATGEQAWHYTRSNARLCGLTATDGLAVAVFRTEDRCDEAVALDAGTGVRAWTRNVNFRSDATLSSTDRIVLAHSPTGVVTLDPTGNNTRWRYAAPDGCRLLGSDAGDAGVAVLQQCDGAAAPQLRLLDGFDGEVHWTRDVLASGGGNVRLLGADLLVGVQAGTEIRLLSATDGTLLTTLDAGQDRPAEQAAVAGAVLVSADGMLTAVDPASASTLWAGPAIGLPGEPTTGGDDVPALAVPTPDGFVFRDPVTGAEVGRSAGTGLPPGGAATAVGSTVVLRLPDRLVAYR